MAKWLDTHGASEYLRVPAQTLKAWRSQGRGPQYRKLPNGKVDYRQDWLDDFSAQHIVKPGEVAA